MIIFYRLECVCCCNTHTSEVNMKATTDLQLAKPIPWQTASVPIEKMHISPCVLILSCMFEFSKKCLNILIPDRNRVTLQVSKALVVSPAPRAFPTRTQAAAWIPKGIYKVQTRVSIFPKLQKCC